MAKTPALFLGSTRALDGAGAASQLKLPAHHLVTHAVVLGMTGSGKTGLTTVMIEEAIGAGVPVLVIDVKGDLPNLLLAFPDFDPARLLPWVEGCTGPGDERSPDEVSGGLNAQRRAGLEVWGISEPELKAFTAKTEVRVITPGSSAGESLHLLSSLERRSARWDQDPDTARAALSAAISLVLRLLGRDPDPAKSREHVLLSLLAERRFREGNNADLTALLGDLADPPIEEVGALPLNDFLPKKDRKELAAALNTLLASPTFASWREGAPLDVGDWLTTRNGRTPAVVVSVAHLEDEERTLVLGVLLEEVLAWVRSLPGSQRLRALVVFDEVYGFLPPHPHNPPTKRPLVALMKQARAFGVGVVIATQNPMDLDYRALSNAGVWCIGRLQTDADRARVIDGLSASIDADRSELAELGRTVQRLGPRWFVLRDAHIPNGIALMQPRWAMSLLRGPMTRAELKRARTDHAQVIGKPLPLAPSPVPDAHAASTGTEPGERAAS
ncbi:MAG: helicase HerA-like domain-containing protein [Polyangiaceae bacterium]